MKKILITGAFGFVGSNLSAYLAARGYELWALDVARSSHATLSATQGAAKVLKCESAKVGRSAGMRECERARVRSPGNAELLLGSECKEKCESFCATSPSKAQSVYTHCFTWEQLEEIPWGEVDVVVHLAGKAHDTKNTSDPQSYFDVNVGLLERVLEAWEKGTSHRGTEGTEDEEVLKFENAEVRECESFSSKDAKAQRVANFETTKGTEIIEERSESGGRKFILFSSVKAVADSVEGVLTEDAVPAPRTAYGQSKLEAEGVVRKCESARVRECESVEEVLKCESARVRECESVEEVLKCESARVRECQQPMAAEGPQVLHSGLQPLGGCKKGGLEGAGSNFRTNALSHSRTSYILRPCMIHGPGNKGNLNLLHGVVRKGIPWPLGAFENQRSFASITNVCAVVEALISKNVEAGIYQVADDEPLSTNQLIGLMAACQGRQPRLWRVPVRLIAWMARVGDVLHLPLNSERLKKLTESYVVSNAKIKGALGWERMPVSAREGLRRTLESFSDQ